MASAIQRGREGQGGRCSGQKERAVCGGSQLRKVWHLRRITGGSCECCIVSEAGVTHEGLARGSRALEAMHENVEVLRRAPGFILPS